MHGAQREDVLRHLGHARLRQRGRLSGGDGPRGAGQLEQRPRHLAGQEPGEHGRGQERGEPRQRHRPLHPAHLRVHVSEGRGHSHDGEAGQAAGHGDVQPPLVGRRAQALSPPDAARDRLLDLGAHEVVLQLRQRGAVEFRITPDLPGGVDQGQAVTDPLAQGAGGVGPAQ